MKRFPSILVLSEFQGGSNRKKTQCVVTQQPSTFSHRIEKNEIEQRRKSDTHQLKTS